MSTTTDMSTIADAETPITAERACVRCARGLETDPMYEMRTGRRTEVKCLRCALLHAPLLWRSVRVALVVGTFLVVLNQGDKLIGAAAPTADLWWKIPLTYCVPFCVATYGALANARRDTV